MIQSQVICTNPCYETRYELYFERLRRAKKNIPNSDTTLTRLWFLPQVNQVGSKQGDQVGRAPPLTVTVRHRLFLLLCPGTGLEWGQEGRGGTHVVGLVEGGELHRDHGAVHVPEPPARHPQVGPGVRHGAVQLHRATQAPLRLLPAPQLQQGAPEKLVGRGVPRGQAHCLQVGCVGLLPAPLPARTRTRP